MDVTEWTVPTVGMLVLMSIGMVLLITLIAEVNKVCRVLMEWRAVAYREYRENKARWAQQDREARKEQRGHGPKADWNEGLTRKTAG